MIASCRVCGAPIALNYIPHYWANGKKYHRTKPWRVACVADECNAPPLDYATRDEALAAAAPQVTQ